MTPLDSLACVHLNLGRLPPPGRTASKARTIGVQAQDITASQLTTVDLGNLAAILLKSSTAASSSSVISAARTSGEGSASVSVKFLSLIQNRSRLSLSRLRISS